jgi:hypothetical protein
LKTITELSGFGVGREALIVGGGHSAVGFRFDLVKNCTVIGLNYHDNTKLLYGDNFQLDYTVYSDGAFSEILEGGYKEKMNTKVIGHLPVMKNDMNRPHEKTDYFYNENIINMGIRSSLWYALQIANTIFHFDNIYLVGIDGYQKKDNMHYYGDTYNGTALTEQIKKFMLQHFTNCANGISKKVKDWKNIYKCNRFSVVDVPYKLPYAEAA